MDYRVEKYIKEQRLDRACYKTAINCSENKCPLFLSCPQMPAMGKIFNKTRASVFFVFGSPSVTDVEAGYPAVSKEGVYFRESWIKPFTLETGGVAYLITHLVRSSLTTETGSQRTATNTETEYCWEHFYSEIMEHRPDVLVCFGDDVFNQIYKKAKNKEKLPPPEKQTVHMLRLTPHEVQMSDDYTPTVFVCHSPSYILKSPASGIFFTDECKRFINHMCKRETKKKSPIIVQNVELLDTVPRVLEFFDFLTRGLPKNEMFDLAFDSETENLNRVYNNNFLSWQFTWEPSKAVFIPIDHPDKPLFADVHDKLKLIDAFQKLLNSSPEESRIAWIIAHNAKFDFSVLYGRYKILPRGTIPIWDTLLGMHWLDENRKGRSAAAVDGKPYSLKTLAKDFFGFEYKSEQLSARAEGDLVALSLDELKDYGGTDTIITWQIKQEQLRLASEQPDNAQPKLERFMRHYYSPAVRAVAFMECNGIFVSNDQLNYLQGEKSPIWNRIARIENVELQQSPEVLSFRENYKCLISGGNSSMTYEEDLWGDDDADTSLPLFNPNKKDQETAFYLEHLGLRPLAFSKKTQKATLNKAFLNYYASREVYLALDKAKPHLTYYNTPVSHEDGEPIFPKNPLQLVLEYRELAKLGGTYLESIREMVEDRNGDCIDNRVRASYWLSGTDSGRLSSSNPNLQNLPAGRSKMAKEIKNLFQAEPPSKRFPQGTALIQLDYKTAEVRWAAIFSNDKNLIRLFNEARESLVKACSPDVVMSEEEFEATQLASDIHRRTASLMYGVDPASVSKSQRQASKCLVGNTKLFTNKGIVSIESLVKDKTDDNWQQRLEDVSVASSQYKTKAVGINHKWVDSTIRVRTKTGIEIEGDSEHPLLVWQDCQLVQKDLSEIKVGDYLVVPRTNDIWPSESPTLSAYVDNKQETSELEDKVPCLVCGEKHGNLNRHLATHNMDLQSYRNRFPNAKMVSPMQIAKRMNSLLDTEHNKIIPKYPTKLTSSLAALLGYLVAEGDGQRYTMSGHADDAKEMLSDFTACFYECFGLTVEVSEYRDFTSTGVIRLPQKVVRYLLDVGLIKGYSETQRVPDIMFRATKSEIKAFLSAYFEGDGSVKYNQIVVTSASSLLMQDIQLLLLSMNIVSTRFTEERITPVGKEVRSYYGLRLGIRDSRLFYEHIGFVSTRKQARAASLSQTSSGRDCIYGLEKLLTELKKTYKRGRRWVIGDQQVRFGERSTKGGKSEVTRELLTSRPYILEALKVWSTSVNNSVYQDIKWLLDTKAALIPVEDISVISGRTKVYDIEVEDASHTFIANGLLSKNCITFGLLFGMGVKTLAANNGWTLEDTEEKVDRFFSAFPDLRRWLDSIQEVAKKRGYVETIMGRRRRLAFLFDTKDFKDEAKASRLAMNAPIQGQSSDGGTIGLFSFLQYLLDNNLERRWIIENVVHDSCLVQVPMEDVEKALMAMQYHFVDGMAKYIKQHFDFTLPLPIECEIEVGLKYSELTKWDGRPFTLSSLLDKLKADAKKFWYTKKEDTGKPHADLDLTSWQGGT